MPNPVEHALALNPAMAVHPLGPQVFELGTEVDRGLVPAIRVLLQTAPISRSPRSRGPGSRPRYPAPYLLAGHDEDLNGSYAVLQRLQGLADDGSRLGVG